MVNGKAYEEVKGELEVVGKFLIEGDLGINGEVLRDWEKFLEDFIKSKGYSKEMGED